MNVDDGMIISLDMTSMAVEYYYIKIMALLEMILLKICGVNIAILIELSW